MSLHRRDFLLALAGLLGTPARVRAAAWNATPVRLAATWQVGQGCRAGLLSSMPGGGLDITAQVELPTRAHGLWREPTGTLLTVARRPGDWLLRWTTEGRALAWRWIEPGRAFAGHLLASPDGGTLYTTEIDLETGAGLLGVRDGATLEKRDEWPTHGLDPHQLVGDATRPDALIVANGGVPTRPETGRARHDLERMDSSLVRLDARSGALLRQWRLDDPRLSLRHLAWNGPCLGIALQAEHDDPARKAAAPVLAVLAEERLATVPASEALAGYGGSIAALGDGFAVSCPRARGLAIYDRNGYLARLELPEVCPLAVSQGRLWAGGLDQALALGEAAASPAATASLPDIRLDNHWIAL